MSEEKHTPGAMEAAHDLLKHLRETIEIAIADGYDQHPFCVPMCVAELKEIVAVLEQLVPQNMEDAQPEERAV